MASARVAVLIRQNAPEALHVAKRAFTNCGLQFAPHEFLFWFRHCMQRWMTSHWEDSRTILKKPFVVAEFGKSNKDAGFSLSSRDEYMGTVYRLIYGFARTSGGTMGGSLIWQLTSQGMESYDDGYAIVLGQNPSTTSVMSRQAHAMAALSQGLVHHPHTNPN